MTMTSGSKDVASKYVQCRMLGDSECGKGLFCFDFLMAKSITTHQFLPSVHVVLGEKQQLLLIQRYKYYTDLTRCVAPY